MNKEAEAEFESRLNALANDAIACARYTYTQLAVDSSTEPEVREFLNEHALFWNTVRSGLQASAIIALGRIYDSRRDTNAAERTLQFAEERPGIFSRDSLRVRKIRSGLTEEVAATFVEDAFEPRQDGLIGLRQKHDEMRGLYEGSAKDLRHNVFAHAGRLTIEELNDLFGNLRIRDFEQLVVFPLQLWDALFGLYWNGRKPVLRDAPTIVNAVIAAGAPKNTNTWEHQHAAAATIEFLESMRPLYPKLYDPSKE